MAEVLSPPPERAPEPPPETASEPASESLPEALPEALPESLPEPAPLPLPLRRRLRTVPGLVVATILVATGVYLALQGMTAVVARGPGATPALAPAPSASGLILPP
ncbi:MAG: hypothetical protein ACYDCI_08150 [Candidatus Limnocylindrales bacterium]